MIKITLAIFILLFFLSATLSAQSETPDSLVRERIEYIQQALSKSKSEVNRWWYGWLGLYSVATVGQGAIFLSSNNITTKQDMALGTATTLIGAVGQLAMPLNTGRDAEILAQLPENTTDEQLAKLAKAEEFLKSNAMKEKLGSSWQIHAVNEAVNLSSGLIVWLGFKRSVWDGIGNFLLNSVVTETQLWTQPTRTQKDFRNYCRKYKSENNPLSYQSQPEYYLKTYPRGVSFSIVF